MDCNSTISFDTSSLLLTRRSECNCASVRSTCCFEYQRVHAGTSEIATLATLPSLDELRGKLVGLLQAPATKIARLFGEPGGQLARLVAARKDALGEG